MKNPIIFIIPLLALAGCSGGDAPLYKDPAQPAEKRAEDLTSRMTLEQKVAQMCQWVGLEHMKSAEKELTEEKLENMFRKYLRIVTDEQLPVDYKSVENFS